MNLARSIRKKLRLISVLLLLFILSLVVYSLSKPSVSLVIEQPYNPVGNVARLNGAVMPLVGKGGFTYRQKINPGNAKIIISGPFITTKEAATNVSFFQKKSVNLKVETVSPVAIIRSTLAISGGTVEEVKVIGNQWIVALIRGSEKPADDGGETFATVLRYNPISNRWDNLTEQITSLGGIIPPQGVMEHYYVLSED